MFGRLLYLSTTKQIDLCEIFKYQLFSEPTCFAYPDGTNLGIQNQKFNHS